MRFVRFFLDFFSKLVWLLRKVTEVTTKYQKWPKISKYIRKKTFFDKRAKKKNLGVWPKPSAGAGSKPA